MTRLEKIEARLDELEKELNSEEMEEKTEEELDQIEEEVRTLQTEKKTILNAATKRASIEKAIAEGRSGVDITNTLLNGGKTEMQERTFDAASKEFRSAWAKSLMGQEMTEIETRARSEEHTSELQSL